MESLDTRWSEAAAAETNEWKYPRPMMVRDEWICLNGDWDFLITDKRLLPSDVYDCGFDEFPFDGKIRVPFSPEAPLSGVGKQLLPDETLWYACRVLLPDSYFTPGQSRLLLHFGAVDQICTVYINGRQAGYHRGGYLPFTLDITDFADRKTEFDILVSVHDFSDITYHARGKQKLLPGGMYYTAQSGIWQTVWMEKVPLNYMESLRLKPDFDEDKIGVRVTMNDGKTGNPNITCQIYAPCILTARGVTNEICKEPIAEAALRPGTEAFLTVPERKPWTPETPWLYPVKLTCGSDVVYSYFAMRKCGVQKDKNGTPRIFLNNRPYFQAGVLDQGYWPDGLYTAPSDEAFIYDIRAMKEMGFNMLRKHAKIEADRWYFHCDRLGMLVWQDMVNGGTSYKDWFVTYLATLLNYLRIPVKDSCRRLLSRTDYDGRQEFIQEVRDTVKTLYNHPSIVCWIPFNEGWGQFSTRKITEMIASLDPGRLIDAASGWFDQGCGDFKSIHYYFFGIPMPRKPEPRAIVVSEFGGLALPVLGHCSADKVYGYQNFKSRKALAAGYRKLLEGTILPQVKNGVSATIYTQLSDVEEEVNGLLTYDRRVTKLPSTFVRRLNDELKNF